MPDTEPQHSLTSYIGDWIFETNEILELTFVSDRFTETTGLEQNDILGWTLPELVLSDRTAGRGEDRTFNLNDRKAFSGALCSIKDADENILHFSVDATPFFGANDAFRGYRGAAHNITDTLGLRHSAEAPAKEKQTTNTLRLLEEMDQSGDAIIAYDSDGIVIFCNDAHRLCYPGITDYIVLGAQLRDILYASATMAQLKGTDKDTDAWVQKRFEERLNPSGRTEEHYINGRWWQISEYKTLDGIAINRRRDITADKNAELRASGMLGASTQPAAGRLKPLPDAPDHRGMATDAQALLAEVVDSMSEGFALFDREDRLLVANSQYQILTGVDENLLVPGALLSAVIRSMSEHIPRLSTDGEREQWCKTHLSICSNAETMDEEVEKVRWVRISGRTTGSGLRAHTLIDISALKAREAALTDLETRASLDRKQLAAAIRSIGDGFAIYDQQNRLVLCNEQYRNVAPAAANLMVPGQMYDVIIQAVANYCMVFLCETDKQAWIDRRLETITGKGITEEVQLSDRRWFRYSDFPVSGGGFVAVRTDITKLKTTETAQKLSESRYRNVINLAPDLICILTNGVVTLINPAGVEMLGLHGEDDVIGHPFEQYAHPDFRPIIRDHLEILIEESEWMPMRLSKRGGETIEMELTALALGEQGDASSIMIVARNVTDRRRIAETLLNREDRLRGILNTVVDAIIVINDHGTIDTFNNAAVRLFGYSVSEVMDKPINDLMPEPYKSEHDEYLRRYLKTGNAHIIGFGRRVVAQRKDGSTFDMELAVSELKRDGKSFFIGVIRDITEQIAAENTLLESKEQAEIANRAKTEFLANMSHELRTPLNAIIGFSDIMVGQVFGSLGDNHYEEYASNIRDSGRHLLGIINDILDVSRIEAGKMELRMEPVNVSEAIESCYRLIQERAEEKTIALTCETQDGLPILNGDPQRIKQILLNLLSNAVKFTPDNGKVVCRAHMDDDGALVFSISDTGIGIADEDIKKAMRPFGQVDSQLARKYEGTGLGLPLTKNFVELHGGTLFIESALGKGTTAFVRFPQECLLP